MQGDSELKAAIIIALMLLAGLAGATSYAVKERPLEVINQFSPLVTWKVNLETDSGGNATFEGFFDGKLYSIDTINATLSNSTNVTVKRIKPYETTIQTVDAYSGNNTTYPRSGSEMYVLMGDIELSITSGQDNVTVPVYLTLER